MDFRRESGFRRFLAGEIVSAMDDHPAEPIAGLGLDLRKVAELALAMDAGDETDLQKHDKRFHPDGFDPEKDSCEFRKKQGKKDKTDALSGPGGGKYKHFKDAKDAMEKLQAYSTDYNGADAWQFEKIADPVRKASFILATKAIGDLVKAEAGKYGISDYPGFNPDDFHFGDAPKVGFDLSYDNQPTLAVEGNTKAMGNDITQYKKDTVHRILNFMSRYALELGKRIGIPEGVSVKKDSSIYMNAPSVSVKVPMDKMLCDLRTEYAAEFEAAQNELNASVKTKEEQAAERKAAAESRAAEYEKTLPPEKMSLMKEEGIENFEAIEKAIADAKAEGKSLASRFEVQDYEDADSGHYFAMKRLVEKVGGRVSQEDAAEYDEDEGEESYGYARGFTASFPPDAAHRLYKAITVDDGYHGEMQLPRIAR